MPTERFKLKPPSNGHKIIIAEGRLKVPDDPIVPIIEGDGIGPDVTKAARRAISAAVCPGYGGGGGKVWGAGPPGGGRMSNGEVAAPPGAPGEVCDCSS